MRKRPAGLTEQQSKLLYFISERLADGGVAPSHHDMMRALGLRSKSGIHRILAGLEERGYIARNPQWRRAVKIISMPAVTPHGPVTARDLIELVERLNTQEGPEVTVAALADASARVAAMFRSTEGNA